MIAVRAGGLDDPQVAALLHHHVAEARAGTPAENAHALDLTKLAADESISFFTAWDGDSLAGMVALKALEPGHGEVKSMRTHPDHLRKGVARLLLSHTLTVARNRGYTRVSLETGTIESYRPANALYEAFGFVDGPVFGGYPPSPYNRFMTLVL